MASRYQWSLWVGMLIVLGTGCAPRRSDMLHFLREHEHEVSAIEYRVGIPDSISISAPRILEIDGDNHGIQPDGKINLRLLGEVKVVGMTAKEIAAKLQVLVSRYYVDPKIRVTISYGSKKFYTRGQGGGLVSRPYTGRDTLLDAVVGANVDFRSWTSRVKVIRPSRDDKPIRIIVVDVDKMIKKGDWSQNILLEPDDIVVVPPTPVAWLALKVRELFYPLGPAIQLYVAPASIMNLDQVYSGDNTGVGFNGGAFGAGGFQGGLP